MLVKAAGWLYRKLGPRYFLLYLGWELFSALLIALGTVGIFALYQDLSQNELWTIVLFSWGTVLLALAAGFKKIRRSSAPLREWVDGARGPEGAKEAWRTAVGLPLEFVTRQWWQPVVLIIVPAAVFITIYLGLPAYSALVIAAGAGVAVVYSAILHFFGSELALRPVIEEIAEQLPGGFSGDGVGAPLRWKLLGALPLINVITGVIVSGLSANDRGEINQLGLDVAVAVLVAFTISLELTLLVTRSVLSPVRDLMDLTERVREGDLGARAPVLSGDEMGVLTRRFNAMLAGLQERERLREAFGSYVAPDVAERVLREGTLLEGEEVEVSIVFVDICDFTEFAERSSARETVTYLNDFFGLVVPILDRNGGHANKFIGDGVLGVFGAPEKQRDHADRALEAACEIALAVEERYGDRLGMGAGINSGPVSAGSVGGGGRLEFTVVGDAVNVAARVERATRELGDRVLLTEATRCLLTRDGIPLEERGTVPLKGKSEPVPIWAPDLEAVERRRRDSRPARADGSGDEPLPSAARGAFERPFPGVSRDPLAR
ncbi:MAG TPA: adenylate/guanylate cyclase domain-containing protein [Thermoleophilaceae bacterium]|nr:adenylate/guanylate cyclase domain-containing protein [Thermoleophilaceae bacterium]